MDWNTHLGLSRNEVLRDLGEGMSAKVIIVTPEKALRWLTYNTENRKLYVAHVAELLADVNDNRFFTTHEAIAFFDDGVLADGQHRLQMVIDSGKAVNMLVVVGVAKEAKLAINDGRIRADYDVAVLSRLEMSQRDIQIGKAILYFPQKSDDYQTKQRRLEFVQKHREALRFADEALAGPTVKGLAQATVAAVIARAFYTVDQKSLKRFGRYLAAGAVPGEVANTEENGAIRLRNHIIKLATRNAGSERRMLYMLATDALIDFLGRGKFVIPKEKSVRKFKNNWMKSHSSMFPLPSEKQEAALAAV